jgi:hypothetical protein
MANSLQADIDAGVEQLSRALDTRSEAQGLDFCAVWPEAKQVLNVIANFVPVVGKVVVSVLVAIGDGVYKKKGCK